MKKIIVLFILVLMTSTQVWAEKRYVTDRILLAVHSEADETSTVVKTIPSGTELEVLSTAEGFIEVRLDDGTEGWVNSAFVTSDTPSTRKYDVLAHQYEKTTQEIDKLKAEFAKKERELEVRRDQLSNANTTIRELKKRVSGKISTDPEMEKKLKEAEQQIATLQAQIAELQAQPKPQLDINEQNLQKEMQALREENTQLKTRIDIAMAHLSGKKIPTAEELESIKPQFPTWYWTLLVVVLLLGAIAGYFFMDYQVRQRHGGFRI